MARGTTRLWRLEVDEATLAYPVLRHTFYGVTKDEAQGTFEAHLKTDAFLRGCVEKERWDGVHCVYVARWLAPGEPSLD